MKRLLPLSALLLALAACDDAGSNSTAPATASGFELFPRAQWVVTDTGHAYREGGALRVETRDIPHWECDGSVRVLDDDTTLARVELDAGGAPSRMVDHDTLKNGTVVALLRTFAPLNDSEWIFDEKDSVLSRVAKDSAILEARKLRGFTGVFRHTADGRVGILLAHWTFGPYWARIAKSSLPSTISLSIPDANTVRMVHASTGESVTLTFSLFESTPIIVWTSSNAARGTYSVGGEPASCPEPSASPSWLSAFLNGR